MKFQVNQRVVYKEEGHWLDGRKGTIAAVGIHAGEGVMRSLVDFGGVKCVLEDARMELLPEELPPPAPEVDTTLGMVNLWPGCRMDVWAGAEPQADVPVTADTTRWNEEKNEWENVS
jgi:hypothetical protein